jgi:lipoate-protein ligase A
MTVSMMLADFPVAPDPQEPDMPTPYTKTTWRLVRSSSGRGAWNMAVDEAVLEACGRGESLPTLRLYSWEPACLSLGYAQPVNDVDHNALHHHGWDLVRRPTGGRAILHTDELTYAVIGPQHESRLAGSVLESYQVLSKALLEALHRLSIPAQAEEKPVSATGGDPKGPVCFEVPSNYEITVNGKKLIGSAQARRMGAVLQHGSFPLLGDLARIINVLCFPDEVSAKQAAARLHERAITAEEILGQPLDWGIAARAFTEAFRATLNLDLQPGPLSSDEQARAEELVEKKYAHPEWTNRV